MSPIKADKLCRSSTKPGELWRPTMKASKLHHLDRQTLQLGPHKGQWDKLCRFTVTTDIWAGAGYWIPGTVSESQAQCTWYPNYVDSWITVMKTEFLMPDYSWYWSIWYSFHVTCEFASVSFLWKYLRVLAAGPAGVPQGALPQVSLEREPQQRQLQRGKPLK